MNWVQSTFIWYLYLLVLGLIFAPLAKKLLFPFYDRGYPFAKTIAILILSYAIYILGLLHLVPFTRESLLLLIAVAAFLIYRRFSLKSLRHFFQRPLSTVLFLIFEEALFVAALFWLSYVRGQEPSIHGLEKFMDFGFIQSILRSAYFPPLDIWLSADALHPLGYAINYYYFGHLTGAMLIRLTNTLPSVGYNLILATIFAQGITLAFSLSANIVYLFQKHVLKKTAVNIFALIFFGLLGCFIVNLGGNLHPIYLFTKGYPNENPPLPFWSIFQSWSEITNTMKSTQQDLLSSIFYNSKYWYPNATRFIPFTIHEFPAYSYVVADLHGHVFDIPFVLLSFAILFIFFIKKTLKQETSPVNIKKYVPHLFPYIAKIKNVLINLQVDKLVKLNLTLDRYSVTTPLILGFLAAVHYMTNAFDGPIYLLLTVTVFFILYQLSVNFLLSSFLLTASFYLFSKPFSLFFSPFVSGIGVNCSPQFLVDIHKFGPFLFEKGNCQISEPWMLGVLWGFFWISAILFLTSLYIAVKKRNKNNATISDIDVFFLIIFAFGTFLTLIPEFFYIKDIYPAHFRANTMFKLGYQAFMTMGIASGYAFYRIKTIAYKIRYLLAGIFIFSFFLIFLYPFFAFPSYYPGLKTLHGSNNTQLDGSRWLELQYSPDKEIIDYFNKHVPGQPVILEAQGDSYTDFERISAYTGLPTVAGWWVHEWLWRGSPNVIGNRIPDVVNMYESNDYQLTKELLKKYHVNYVVISEQEKSKYPNLNENKFKQIGSRVFISTNGNGAIYRVN
ncbi:hypothetical protein A3H86_03910 [Candidatus Roizmanbacteria bacterium RIFCSPLOWO2_02_FULL_41_9]|uniref:YYY membrane protein n=1 Tax=Candidatus Roizmanbacteria bacterium RIFCSPLOWO2_02_FULL_41_9 TaxID=1802077 RepID=A0A1F7JRT0_9BACT|nr:MAG: hypothetical protein A3H86_03910 [Candidatus Roizmanbacteria bacterium RIFCSPLOWO2_02_FULL_41_9]